MIDWLLNVVPWWVPPIGLFVAMWLTASVESECRRIERDWWDEA